MTHRKKITSQSGFMSVEAIATTLFYLIMVAVITLIASQVMNTGKMAASLNSLSLVRVNIQYVGTSVASYDQANNLRLDAFVSGLKAVDSSDASKGAYLPTSHIVKAAVATAASTSVNPDTEAVFAATDPLSSYFTMTVTELTPQDCRRIGYYGIGSGYGVMLGATIIKKSTAVSDIETGCTPGSGASTVNAFLTSK